MGMLSDLMPETKTAETSEELAKLIEEGVLTRAPEDRKDLLSDAAPELVVEVLKQLPTLEAVTTLRRFPREDRTSILDLARVENVSDAEAWNLNLKFEEGSVGELMSPPTGLLTADITAAQAVDALREMVKSSFITYVYVVDERGHLDGIIVMRDLMLASQDQKLSEIMMKNPFFLTPEQPLMDAMKEVLNKHYPVYPVCEPDGRLVGLVRGHTLFEQQAVELSAQAGSMVGIEKEERLSTPWQKSLLYRHPWLQLNLLTAFVAAAVVGVFEGTLEEIVLLAVFLPVMAGQSGNTGCQALAVALRGMTLGEAKKYGATKMLSKEALLGLCNGALVGVTAGIGMFIYANIMKNPHAIMLGVIVFLAMIVSCVISGIAGVAVPLALKKFGADPATASSIFLTTATDVFSMGAFLGLATWLLI